MMIKRSPAPYMPYLLGILTLLYLLALYAVAAPASNQPTDLEIMVIMIGMVAFVVNVEVPLEGGTISLGYAAALLTYLTLGRSYHNHEAFTVMAIGGAIGGLIRALWRNREAGNMWRLTPRLIERPLSSAARLVLSMAAGDVVYRLTGGRLPLTELRWVDAVPLFLLVIISVGTYLALFSLWLWARGLNVRSIFHQNVLAIVLTIGLPIPFVIAAAFLFSVSSGGFIALIIGLGMLAIGATALGNGSIRYREQVVELQSLSAVSRTMRTYLDLETLLSTVHLQVATLLNVDNFTLALFDLNRNILRFPIAMQQMQLVTLPEREPGNELLDYVVNTKAPLLINGDVAEHARLLKLAPPPGRLTAWLGVPLLAPERAIGCIAVATSDPARKFSERDQRILLTIGTQASIAIENAQLYRQVSERATQITRLNNIAVQLSGTLDPQRVLELVAQSAMALTGASGAAVFTWRDSAHMLMGISSSVGLKSDIASNLPLPRSMGKGLQPFTIQNMKTDAHAGAMRDVMLNAHIHALLELPLYNGVEELGVVVSYFREARKFSGDELELLQTFANQAALAISNARQHRLTDEALEDRIEQLSALALINHELSSTLNVQTVFDLVLDRAIEATKSSYGLLLLSDNQNSKPRFAASRGHVEIDIRDITEDQAVYQALDKGVPVISEMKNAAGRTLSQLGVPLLRDLQTLGVLMLVSEASEVYSEDDIHFVHQLATLASIAMENARLFESMTESRNRLQVILDSMYEAVILFDLDGRIALANPRVESLLGIEVERVTGRPLASILNEPGSRFAEQLGFDSESLDALFDTLKLGAWRGGGRLSYRLEYPRISFIDRTIVSVLGYDNKSIGLLLVFADATEERELAQAREDLSRMIVHDLRSPLTAINASMKLLSDLPLPEGTIGKTIRQTGEVSQRALRKLLHLVDSLLDIAKMESGNISLETEEVFLRTLAENVRLELLPLAEELNVEVRVVIDPELPQLVIDGYKIERVLLNLVDNALKFVPLNGLVQIRARKDGIDMVRVEVVDNGPGVADEYKKKIFDRFQQSDQSGAHRRGTGLGLTFCRLTVEAHGGSIWIEDNPGGGSIFAFVIPLVVASDSEAVRNQA